MPRSIALLRAVNVGGRKLAMAELRDTAAALGWVDIVTYIQSGNLLFSAEGQRRALETDLEVAIRLRFGMTVPVMIRTATEWERLLAANPLSGAARDQPSRVLLCLPKEPPDPAAATLLQDAARDGEIVKEGGGALWIHYADGVGRSRLSPSLIDRAAGSPVTARNWNTVSRIAALATASA